MSTVAIIPARFASTRFPGKLLQRLHGRSLLEHVHRRALLIRGCDSVVVATDDERIVEEVRRFGGDARLTSPDHASGTDRIGELLSRLSPRPEFVLNLQGDEPLFSPRAVERMLKAMRGRPDAIWTLAERIREDEEFQRPSVVKVVCAHDGRALYFSRAPVPYRRPEANGAQAQARRPPRERIDPLRHVGVYGYPRALLLAFLVAGRSALEECEGLEQLRALDRGIPIRVLVGAWPDAGVDTPEDLERLRSRYPTPEALASAGMEPEEPGGGLS